MNNSELFKAKDGIDNNSELYIEKETDSPYLRRIKSAAKKGHEIVERNKGRSGQNAENMRFKSKTLDFILRRLKNKGSLVDSGDALDIVEELVESMDIYNGLDGEYIAANRFNDERKLSEIKEERKNNKIKLGVVCDIALNELGIDFDDLQDFYDQDDDSEIALVWDQCLDLYNRR